MSSSNRLWKVMIGIVVFVAVAILVILLIRGCVERRRDAFQQRRAASAGNSATTGDSLQSQPDSAGQQPNQPAPPQAAPDEEDGGAPAPVEEAPLSLRIVEQRVTPYRSTPGQAMAYTAGVSGDAVSVTMYIVNTAGGGEYTVQLIEGPTIDGTTNWAAQGQSPSPPGTYSYSTTAAGSDGGTVQEQGSTFIVEEEEGG